MIPLSIHVMVAAMGDAVLSPTPTPLSTACVARVPVMYELNAYNTRYREREGGASLARCPIFDIANNLH